MHPQFYWDLPDNPAGNVVHIAEHGLTIDEVVSAFVSRDATTIVSRSTGSLVTFGTTHTGRAIAIVWEEVNEDPLEVYVITAYEPDERE